ncbi:MAG: HNH endonuclease signature motif containing protein [Ramlibacter sp.]
MATNRPRLTTLKSSLATVPSRLQTMTPGSWRGGKQGSTARGYGYRWQQASKAFLCEHPLCQCEDCQEGAKRVTAATVVDHHIPHRGDERLFWDRSNWRAMAKPCHDKKTQAETAAGWPTE